MPVTHRVTLPGSEDFTGGCREQGLGSDLDAAVRTLLQQSGW